jgi:hypothetical protein
MRPQAMKRGSVKPKVWLVWHQKRREKRGGAVNSLAENRFVFTAIRLDANVRIA